ncbi:MAG: hypothetical protein H6740_23455 [Alphaproteobacteria bacterium]|nr:hypothetical protein [Alphaproteobacteria bacterium]
MRNLLLLGAAFAFTSGCVIYESESCGWDDDGSCPFDDDLQPGDDWTDTDGDGIPDDDRDDLTLAFYPAAAEQGEVFLASITVADGEADLTEVSGLHLYGPAEVLVWGARPGEITATLAVPEDAAIAEVDVVVEFEDGTAELLPAALSIYPKDSGNSAGDWADGAPSGEGDCE